MTRRPAAVLALALLLAGLLAGCGSDDAPEAAPVDRVLIVTLPGITWADVEGRSLPTLDRLVDDAAIGDVSTRIGRTLASTTAAYLTLGSGTRAVVPGVDTGVALNPDEPLGGVPAADLLQRRLGRTVDGIAYIPVGATIDANATSAFGAVPGTLGDALDAAGVHRAVIANADAAEGFPTDEPPPDGAYARSAATTLMGSDGVVPGGSVGRGLLREDPAAPFGRRLDPTEVLRTFDQEWQRQERAVVLVEASDLSRASAYSPRSSPDQARKLTQEALEDADALLGDLLERVDPESDAVLVLAPTASGSLGIAALSTPQVDDGLLRSASTRRDGYLYLAAIAPTVLELVGEEPPTDIEGRPLDVAASSADRMDLLIRQNDDAATRDARLPVVVVLMVLLLAGLAWAAHRRERLGARDLRLVRFGAMAALGLIPGTFLASLLPVARASDLAYLVVLIGVALGVAGVGALAERRRGGAGPIVACGSILVTVIVDVVLGAHLQVNTVFGYSMAVAGRFTGLGNLAFALFSSAAICLAVLLHERGEAAGSPRAGRVALAALVVVVLVEGLPMLGADVGGTLAVVPAFCLTVLALRGRRIGWREVLAVGALALVAIAVLGLLDTSQPAGSETHLARLGEQLGAGRLDAVATTLWRRINASFGAGPTLAWLLGGSLVALAVGQAVAVATGRIGPSAPRRSRTPAGTGLLVGLGTLAGIGLVANDSSVAVPATMLLVVVPVLILRTLDPAPAADRSAS